MQNEILYKKRVIQTEMPARQKSLNGPSLKLNHNYSGTFFVSYSLVLQSPSCRGQVTPQNLARDAGITL